MDVRSFVVKIALVPLLLCFQTCKTIGDSSRVLGESSPEKSAPTQTAGIDTDGFWNHREEFAGKFYVIEHNVCNDAASGNNIYIDFWLALRNGPEAATRPLMGTIGRVVVNRQGAIVEHDGGLMGTHSGKIDGSELAAGLARFGMHSIISIEGAWRKSGIKPFNFGNVPSFDLPVNGLSGTYQFRLIVPGANCWVSVREVDRNEFNSTKPDGFYSPGRLHGLTVLEI